MFTGDCILSKYVCKESYIAYMFFENRLYIYDVIVIMIGRIKNWKMLMNRKLRTFHQR